MAPAKRSAKGKKQKNVHGPGSPDVPGSLFTKPDSDLVAGEVILQLEEGTAATISESIARGPVRDHAFSGATTFGITGLDAALAKLKVTSLTRLHPPAPVTSMAMAESAALASTFRVKYDQATSPAQAAEALAQLEGVQYAEPNRYRESYVVPNDPSFASQWGLSKINAPAAWDRTTGSASVVVAVIDTGVDLDHPELAPLIVPGTDMVDLGPSPVAPAGFRFEGDFQGRDNVPKDEVGHGTHVAGTIACLSNNGVGVAGVTWQCRIMPVRVLARLVNIANPADVRGTGSAADIAAGIRWAVDNGARVLNLSLGGSTDTQVERDAIAYAIAHGVVVCAAMGNAGAAASPSFPAAYPDVVAVGAIDQADHRATFSQVGPHIDVAAPGVGILSTVWNDGFTTMSGTSMATPHVAGVAALVLSCNPALTGAQVADILRQTARPLRDNPADPIPNNSYGFGCIDAQAAVARACPSIRKTVVLSTCPTRFIVACRPSLQLPCPSLPVTCRSEIIRCRSEIIVACRPTVTLPCKTLQVSCQLTQPISCQLPSRTIRCPTPSATVACPSGPVCGGPGPIDPGPLGGAIDPELEGYDPYSAWYGNESE